MERHHPRSMLYRPVYLKPAKKIQEAVIPEGRPPPIPPVKPPPPALVQPPREEEEQADELETLIVEDDSEEINRLPLLIASYQIVIPHEATRDVLSGRIPYLLVEDEGVTVFKPAHLFAALKLKKHLIKRYEDYSCVGAYQRMFINKSKKRVRLGYRRKYISPELIGKGIYGPDTGRRAMSSGPLFRGFAGPRA